MVVILVRLESNGQSGWSNWFHVFFGFFLKRDYFICKSKMIKEMENNIDSQIFDDKISPQLFQMTNFEKMVKVIVKKQGYASNILKILHMTPSK